MLKKFRPQMFSEPGERVYNVVWWPYASIHLWGYRSKGWVVRDLRLCTLFGKGWPGFKRVCPYVLKRIGVIHSDRKKM